MREDIRKGDGAPAPAWRSIEFWVFSTLVLVASVGTVLSYAGIREWGLSAGYPGWAASLLPIPIDGMVFAGVLQVLHATKTSTSRRFGWFLTVFGAVISVAANSITAHDPLKAAAHGLPSIAVVLTVEAMLSISRQKIKVTEATAAALSRQVVLEGELADARASAADAIAAADASVRTAREEADRAVKELADARATASRGFPNDGRGSDAIRVAGPPSRVLSSVPPLSEKKQKLSREQMDLIAQLKAEGGKTNQQIADEVGTSLASVKRYACSSRSRSQVSELLARAARDTESG